jgi:hypothetical protein
MKKGLLTDKYLRQPLEYSLQDRLSETVSKQISDDVFSKITGPWWVSAIRGWDTSTINLFWDLAWKWKFDDNVDGTMELKE